MKRIDITKPGKLAWVATTDDGEVVASELHKDDCIRATAEYAESLGEPVTVKIHREDGTFEEERTYPRSADPRRSPG